MTAAKTASGAQQSGREGDWLTCCAPGPAGGVVQPERSYNEAGGGGVPSIKRQLVLASFYPLSYPGLMTEPEE
jgi:hypothetical protein